MKCDWTSMLLLAATLSGCCLSNGTAKPTDAIRVGTYNVRMSPGDRGKANAWESRRADMVALVRRLDLDVFGLQEVCPDQMAYLREQLPEWTFVGDHREADRVSGEASPVCYRKSRFEQLKGGTFWLSETPEVPASKSWGTACTRVCSYLVLKDRLTGKTFCFANTHTDHKSALAREKGMMLIIERMKDFGAGAPIVFTGDHNNTEIDRPSVEVAKVLRNALYETETPPTGPWRTWNGWRWMDREVSTAEALSQARDVRNGDGFEATCSGPRIDYIWVSDGVRVLDYTTVGTPRPSEKLYPSDHFPVVSTVALP